MGPVRPPKRLPSGSMQKNARISELSRQGGPPRARYAWPFGWFAKRFLAKEKCRTKSLSWCRDMEVWDLWLLEGGKHKYSLVFVRIFNCLQMIWGVETLSQYPARFFSTESALETLEAQNHPNSSWMNWRTHSKSFNTRNKNKTVKRFWNMFWTCSIICTMISVSLWNIFQPLWNCPTRSQSQIW